MTTPQEELLPGTRRALLHRIAVAQTEGRAPSLVATVVRGGKAVWTGARTSVEGHAPDENVQYRIGSITKTFTAVLVLRLRDERALDLSDPLDKHLPGTGVGQATIADLLAHSGGLAAETPAPWWERTSGALRPGLADALGERPLVHPVGRRFHYSNPGYALLGALVEKLRDARWEEVLRREVLEPLGLHRTSAHPQAPHAGGWAVHPWADVMLPEPLEDLGVMAPAGQLWSTTSDLARFAAFLAEGDDRVLSAESLREMRTPAAPAEAADVASGYAYGLGMELRHQNGRALVGHTGSLPGFLACLTIGVADDVSAVVLANCTSGPAPFTVAADLVRIVAEAEPRIPAPWEPLREADPAVLELVGQWYWGTYAFALRLSADGLVSLEPLSGNGRRSRFRPKRDGTWVGLEGYYAGELLKPVRRPDGAVSHLDLGSFVFTRQPYEEGGSVPGGVDPEGWRGIG
ncbi:serine hydrolase domain-containing protein [Streptomyces griseoloalbus]|uniref:CubicO group peptidase (Beta-lactamase class C family) n=1 Tax=Streptomyces griseoloalbus TaxID=67303 RepID=A0A7W8BRN3_9ACTN|nr:serine hydrolase domain-containing protein [Streptomyces albaduncus]MBB5127722.1 CubicO group peptidase (beta-lactamase class C family) [Streptomyces albaduncus]GGW61483.1 serine hydrolase [Streptomyces albaduncus]